MHHQPTAYQSVSGPFGHYARLGVTWIHVATSHHLVDRHNGGTPVFAGTRVPVKTLLDYLEAGDGIDEFLAGFPAVSRAQVVAFLERAMNLAVHDAA